LADAKSAKAVFVGAKMRWFTGSSGSALASHDVKEAVVERTGSDGDLASGSWGLFAGTRRSDGAGVSVFRLARSAGDEASTKVLSAARCVRRTKTLRHPHVLAFHEGVCDADKAGGEICVCTDECLPLGAWLGTAAGADRRALDWGAYCALSGLHFLHQSGRAHGNVSGDAFYVTNSGDW